MADEETLLPNWSISSIRGALWPAPKIGGRPRPLFLREGSMPEYLDKQAASSTPIAAAIRLVLAASGVRSDPADRSDEAIVAWATPLVEAVAQRVFPPRHMDGEDLRQEIWMGIIQALRSYNPARGSLRHWAARWALQRAYDAVRWAARHEDEMAALEIGEVEALLEDLRAAPEDVVFRQQPRERLARQAATLARSASAAARALLHELMIGNNGTAPEERLTALGLTPQQIDRARTELRALGVAAMRRVISENSVTRAQRRP